MRLANTVASPAVNGIHTRPLRLMALISTVILLLAVFPVESAQLPVKGDDSSTAVELPENLTREQVRDLVARMSDDQVRELIITRLDKLADAQQVADIDRSAAYISQLSKGLEVAGNSLVQLFASDDRVHQVLGSVWQQLTQNGNISGWYLLFQLVGLFVAGLFSERLVRRLFKNIGRQISEVDSAREIISALLLRAVLGLIEIGAFVAGAEIFLTITSTEVVADRILWEHTVEYIVIVKMALLILNLFVAPDNPANRVIPIQDNAANEFWWWALAIMLILMLPINPIMKDLGFSNASLLLISLIFSSAFIASLIALILRLRLYGAGLIAGSHVKSGSGREGLARTWWILAIFYVLLIWFMAIGKRAATGESSLVPGLGSLILFSLIPYIDMGLQWLIARYFVKDKDKQRSEKASVTPDGQADSAVELVSDEAARTTIARTRPGYQLTALRYARVLLGLAILIIFVRLWNIDLEAITAQLVGERVSSALFDIGLTLVLIWAVWGVFRIAIERKLSDEQTMLGVDEEGGGGGGSGDGGGLGGTRLETVLPIFRIFVKISMIVMAVLLALSALGVDIGPLIAGAGVIGIAIGFGAQSLVRDIVSGLFFLMDDAFRVGEYVAIDAIRGTVERISIRSFQLRHHNGIVHTIPYGEIKSLSNYSRDWAIMKFELRVPYETDIDLVRKIIKNLGKEMKEDPVFGANMLEPLKSQGVNRMDDSALIIRCKFTAVPGQQFLIRREAFTRIQRAFEKEGIHFAPRRVLVESVSPAAAAAAAAGVLDQELPGGKGGSSDQR